jgi:hypothetical protein
VGSATEASVSPRRSTGGLRAAVLIVAELGTVTRALLTLVRDGEDHHGLAGRICQACVDGLDVDGASISLLTGSASREILWATDPIAELLEDLQFTSVTEQSSVRALFALPLQWGAVNVGVLDLYRVTPGGLSDVQWRDAVAATNIVALMVLGQRTSPGECGGWLDQALGHRAEIHQATGMVRPARDQCDQRARFVARSCIRASAAAHRSRP